MREATPDLREARRMLAKGIVIAGVGETEQGILPDRGSFQLLAEVTKITLDDAGIELKDVDGLVTAFSFVESTLMHATTLADYLGMEPGYFASVAVGGATAPLMAVQAALAIDAGLAETVLCVRGDNTRSGISSSGMIAMAREMSHGAFEAPYGLTTIGGYGLLAQRYMHEHNVPQEALAQVVATQSEHAALKWNAMLRNVVTVDDVMNDRWIATPFHAMDCSLVSDGAAAFLVTTEARAKSMRKKPVYITGIGEGYSHQYITEAKSVDGVRQGLGRAGRRAMEVAGITPQDLDVAQIYDSFSFTPLIALEGFGICGPGEAGDWMLEGNGKLGSSLPVNTHGGLIRQAHLGAMHHIVEAVLQLRGEADDTERGGGNHQVPDAKLAITNGSGGILAATSALVLSSEPPSAA
ncbi:MAG: thiolase family protein [Actinomycetota bacterium]